MSVVRRSSFSLGDAGEGAEYIIEEPTDEPNHTLTTNKEQQHTATRDGADGGGKARPDGTDVPADDPDAMRAASLRQLKHTVTAAVVGTNLPGLPQSDRANHNHRSAVGTRRRAVPTRSCPQRWWRGFRICLQWRILRHLIAATILPFIACIALFIYLHMPSNLSFVDALIQGDLRTVNWYLDTQRMSLNDAIDGDDQRRNPLHFAAIGNSTQLVQQLVGRGAFLDIQDDNGFTPLHYASNVGNMLMADFLLSAGAAVDALDLNKRTPLHIAAINGNVPVLAVLIFNGAADLTLSDRDAYRATDYARLFHGSAMQQLIDDGYYAAMDGRIKMIENEKFEQVRKRGGRETNKKKKKAKKSSSGGKKKKQAEVPLATLDAHESAAPAVDDSDDFMSLFTGSDDAAAASSRYQRAAAAAENEAQHRRAIQHEIDAITQGGEVDSDEFDI